MSVVSTGFSRTERYRILTMKEAGRLRGEHPDTIKRNEPDKIIRLSQRRLGMRLADALKIPLDD